MKKIGFAHSLKGLFQRKKKLQDHGTVSAKRDWKDVFSYSFGKPDDEVTREAFRTIRELRNKSGVKKSGPEKGTTGNDTFIS